MRVLDQDLKQIVPYGHARLRMLAQRPGGGFRAPPSFIAEAVRACALVNRVEGCRRPPGPGGRWWPGMIEECMLAHRARVCRASVHREL